MSPATAKLIARYRQMPLAGRLAVVVVGLVSLFVFMDDYTWSYAREWSQRGDQLESLLHRGALRQAALPKDIERAAIAFGNVEVPSDEASTSQSLAKSINAILKQHHIANSGYESLSGGKLPSNAMPSVAGAGRRIERIRGQVSFDADVDEVAPILADLEADPAIDAIYSLRLNKVPDTRKVTVKLLIESWALSSREARRVSNQ